MCISVNENTFSLERQFRAIKFKKGHTNIFSSNSMLLNLKKKFFVFFNKAYQGIIRLWSLNDAVFRC